MKKFRYIQPNPEFVYSTMNKTVLDDIICDICQNSCKNEQRHEEYEDGDELKEYDFTFLTINGSFGYFSKEKDGEFWEAHICEGCIENYLEKIVCFHKTDGLMEGASNTSQAYQDYKKDYHDFLNKRANRIRKIRKMTGNVEFEIRNKKSED